eukprot:13118500-Alexandrium_andersonii.AAC.1
MNRQRLARRTLVAGSGRASSHAGHRQCQGTRCVVEAGRPAIQPKPFARAGLPASGSRSDLP